MLYASMFIGGFLIGWGLIRLAQRGKPKVLPGLPPSVASAVPDVADAFAQGRRELAARASEPVGPALDSTGAPVVVGDSVMYQDKVYEVFAVVPKPNLAVIWTPGCDSGAMVSASDLTKVAQ